MVKVYKKKASTFKVRRGAKPRTSLKKLIKSIVMKNEETKTAVTDNGLVAFNGAINSAGDCGILIPPIGQGVDDGQRVGNQVKMIKFSLRGHLIMGQSYGTSLNATRICCRMMIVQPKRFANSNDVYVNATSWLPELLTSGTTNKGFDGNINDLYLPINRDAITVYHDQLIYLNIPFQNSSTITNVAYDNIAQSVKIFKTINIKSPKLLKFADQVSNQPQNTAPTILLGYAHLDGSTADTVNTQVSMQVVATMQYKDA